jgi:hypothetical protein
METNSIVSQDTQQLSRRGCIAVLAGAPLLMGRRRKSWWPRRVRLLAGEKATFTVTVRGSSPVRYQWQRGTATGIMVDIAGATKATYTTPSTTIADHKTLFRSVVSNSSSNATSAAEALFVAEGGRTR